MGGEEYNELTSTIIGCAFDVYNEMGFGYLEKVYERCMTIALRDAGHTVTTQCPLSVQFRGERVGEYIADMVVDDTCIVELKSAGTINPNHGLQLVHYLTAAQKPVGLVLNFGPENVEIARRTLDWKPDVKI